MNQISIITIFIWVAFTLGGCTFPHIVQPLRLYDLESGNTLEVIFHATNREHGTISSSNTEGSQFRGEYVLYDRGITYPGHESYSKGTTSMLNDSTSKNFADLYGFSKEYRARPVGTGIIVGDDGTVIEIIFYNIAHNLESGDGVGKDNKGRYYRIYLSTESR
ncbi:MAG: hypothetical protein HY960_12800 [Ignavibacteriae bacterium]|nr:hypothetical protein [Ignavibacteriota bacterium]